MMSASQARPTSEAGSLAADVCQSIAVGYVVPTAIEPPVDSTAHEAPSDDSADVLIQSTELETPDVPVPPSWLWLREHDQVFVGVCIAAFLLVSGYHWAVLSGWGAVPLEVDRLAERRYDYKIDINSGGLVEWTQIEGIGEATALKILHDREVNGPFRNITDLKRIKGIGPATVEKIRPFVSSTKVRNSSAASTDDSSDRDQL